MNRTEWTTRCAARLIAAGGHTQAWARLEAETCADEQAELHGASGAAWARPEDAADQSLADDAEEHAC